MPVFSAIAAGISLIGAVATGGGFAAIAAAGIGTTMVAGAIVGAVVGGVVAAVKGENILKGALFGGLIGAAAGGALGWAASSMAAAEGAAATSFGEAGVSTQTAGSAWAAGGNEISGIGMTMQGGTGAAEVSAGVAGITPVTAPTTAAVVGKTAGEMSAAELQLAMTTSAKEAAATAGKYSLLGAGLQGAGGLFGPDEEQMQKDALAAAEAARQIHATDINRVQGTATYDPTKYNVNNWYKDLPSDLMARREQRFTDENIYRIGTSLTSAPASTGAPKPSETSGTAVPKPQPVVA